jgi:hypothetical protein
MIRNAFLGLSLILCSSVAVQAQPSPNPDSLNCTPGHGFWLIPDSPNSFYLSHKPMASSSCHQFQLILRARFVGTGKNVADGKIVKPETSLKSDSVYTLQPPNAPRKLSSYGATGAKFPATLWRGNYEGQGTECVRGCSVEVTDVIVKITELKKSDGKAVVYLFGTPGRAYVANRIDVGSSNNDLNQIFSVLPSGNPAELKTMFPNKGSTLATILSVPSKPLNLSQGSSSVKLSGAGSGCTIRLIKRWVNAAPNSYL